MVVVVSHFLLVGTAPGARRRGRPRTAWMDNVKMWSGTGLSVEESIRMTEDRDRWRKYVHGVADRRLKNRTDVASVRFQLISAFERTL